MTNVDLNLNSLGISEILFRTPQTQRAGLVSGMLFMSGARLFYISGAQIVEIMCRNPIS